MSFAQLYEHAAALGHRPVRVKADLTPKACELADQHVIRYVEVELDEDVSLGHIKQWETIPPPYAGEGRRITEIRFSKELNYCWRRFVCCKELMHVFDPTDARPSTSELFLQFLRELETQPPTASAMLRSENQAVWMAMAVLCPEPVRIKRLDDWRGMTPYDVALELRIPEPYVRPILHVSFPDVVEMLLHDLG